ncbi:GTPase [Streptomyces sp. NPDC088726]|uniref:GTPase n=1 Tax=Streptomyces sp. NPDC088726 TaxID=3365874 RepID=UPI0038086CA1
MTAVTDEGPGRGQEPRSEPRSEPGRGPDGGSAPGEDRAEDRPEGLAEDGAHGRPKGLAEDGTEDKARGLAEDGTGDGTEDKARGLVKGLAEDGTEDGARDLAKGRRTDPGGTGCGWDDGLIARRAAAVAVPQETPAAPEDDGRPQVEAYVPSGSPLGPRLDALRELVGLSRARLDRTDLAEAGRVLDEAAARQRLSSRHTVVAIAGASGSGKSTLFNSLAGAQISEAGLRRPTTASPIACSWTDGAAGLLDRLAIPGRLRRRPQQGGAAADEALQGLVLVDLPDHDSAAAGHREQVDRVLALVDAVVWVVDPEKYADAALHERYLRPLAGHAEVTFVVLNQIDRLPGDAADQVLDDLRRLLDEDGMALGEHGDPGATVLSLSALTGEGVGELRELLGRFVQERTAATRRLSADVDAAAARLRPVYVAEGRTGLGERAREEFADRLAEAVGAAAAGQAAEREWRRNAGRACGTPWLRLWRWYESTRHPRLLDRTAFTAPPEEQLTARQRVEQAVRTVADDAVDGLPGPWAQAVREAAVHGARGLPEALDELAGRAAAAPGRGAENDAGEPAEPGARTGARTGAHRGRASTRPPRPAWWPAAVLAQVAMTLLQIFGGLWLIGQIIGVLEPGLLTPALVMLAGIVGGPLVEWSCAAAARGPARRYGQEAERRLREAAAACGRARVLDPVSAELVRYREVRERFVAVTEFSTTGR